MYIIFFITSVLFIYINISVIYILYTRNTNNDLFCVEYTGVCVSNVDLRQKQLRAKTYLTRSGIISTRGRIELFITLVICTKRPFSPNRRLPTFLFIYFFFLFNNDSPNAVLYHVRSKNTDI